MLQMMKENDVKYVDYRFTDPRGKWQHLAMATDAVDEDALTEGVMFDGSSIAGWKAINESDMTLAPLLNTWYAAETLAFLAGAEYRLPHVHDRPSPPLSTP